MVEESGDQAQQDQSPPRDRGGKALGGFAAGVLVGAMLGIGLGLLFAPERGDAARRRLRKRLARLRERAEGGLERAGKRTRRELKQRRRRMAEALERVRERRG